MKMFLLFDTLYILFTITIYVSSITMALFMGSLLWGDSLFSKACAIVLGYFLFLHFFVIHVAFLRKIIQRPLKVGVISVGLNKDYLAWGFNSLFHGVVIASPFASQIFFIFYLNWLYYNLMGMKLPYSTLIGTNTVIRQPELIDIGERTVIGIGCMLSGHYAVGKKHRQGRIVIGSDVLIGTSAHLSPGITVGDHVLLGAKCTVLPNVKIGNHVDVGPDSVIYPGVRIPAGVRITERSVVMRGAKISEGETWGGDPAIKLAAPLKVFGEKNK